MWVQIKLHIKICVSGSLYYAVYFPEQPLLIIANWPFLAARCDKKYFIAFASL